MRIPGWPTAMKAVLKYLVRVCAAAALWAFCPPFAASGAEDAPPRLKYGSRVVCPGEYRGHLQGLATDGKSIYWVFSRDIVKTDFTGRVLAKRSMPHHSGDPCWHDGKLYVPVCGSGFNRKPKPGAVSKNRVCVFDAELKPLAEHPIPELEYGAGGMAVHDGRFFIVGGRPKELPGNTVYEYDAEFKLVRRHELEFDSLKGIQTINRAFGKWYFGCYGTNGLTVETDGEFRVLRRLRPGTAVGMIPLANGLVLAGRIVKGKVHNRSGGAARVVRFTVPAAKGEPPKTR